MKPSEQSITNKALLIWAALAVLALVLNEVWPETWFAASVIKEEGPIFYYMLAGYAGGRWIERGRATAPRGPREGE